MTFRWTQILMLCGALAMGACGDDDGNGGEDTGSDTNATDTNMEDTNQVDANMEDTSEDVAMEDTGMDVAEDANMPSCDDLAPTQGADNVIISQINLGTNEIELFNPTDADLNVSTYQLCAMPGYTAPGDVTVPAGGYAVVSMIGIAGQVTNDMGEMAIYTSSNFTSRDAMVDFVCWGGDRTPTRKGVAEMSAGGEVLWVGPCVGAATNGIIARNANASGTRSGDYTTPAAPIERCSN